MVAAVSLNYDPVVSAVAQRLIAGKVITKEEAQYVTSISYVCRFKCIQTKESCSGFTAQINIKSRVTLVM